MKKTIVILFIMSLLIITNCNISQTTGKTGELVLGFSMDQYRTLVPTISMVPADYLITGTNTKGDVFTRNTSSTSMTITDLVFDTWTVKVEAKNAQGTVIGSGTSTAVVHPDEQTIVNITVTPLPGIGSLDISATWNAAYIEYPTIVSQLIPQQGAIQNLNFNISGNNASYTDSSVSTGYYTVIVKLFDGNPAVVTPKLSTGIVEVVRIVKDQLTQGSFIFNNLNPIGGSIQVLINPEMADPITITITGQQSPIALGSSMTVTASVPAEIGNVVYVWYINGVSVGTGESYTVNTAAKGFYNLSITAFTPDGKRGGSFNYEYKVE